MGFHRRRITNELVISSYNTGGVDAVWSLFTKGVDAIVLNGELAIKCAHIIEMNNKSDLKKVLQSLDK
tara:strand:+ start:1676 stop:1879 length:204 start_codon:yes stop_codon:yes gene_type:complete